MQCPFCEIIKDDKYGQIIWKGDKVSAIKKLCKPRNVNFLIISNEHIVNLKGSEAKEYKHSVVTEMVDLANFLSKGKDWSIHINNGPKADQTVFHLHAHISSREPLESWFPKY
ncbi:MAG: histidine triad (HIT) protein [Barrevirus sp.]|uniref:Histidine triad (HIT) protein n=1 Tax=Barrevirus sp. TaxID=2487763 RepID=A0A3G4ZTR1_9VIRU|nr:MAG: histidine triad (HIT) protein [Barrevirus sp.]